MAAAPGRTVRDYVVLQEYDLPELLRSFIDGLELEENMSALLYERLADFKHQVYVKAAVIEAARNAPAALRAAGSHMRRPTDHDRPVVVPAVAVPASQWSTEDIRLTPRLDVEVGGV